MATTRRKKPAKPRRKRKSFIRTVARGRSSPSTRKRTWASRVLRGTAKGTARLVAKYSVKAAKATSQRVERFRDDRRFAEGYTPEPGEIPKGRWSRTATEAGGRRFDSPEAAMAYADKVAATEPEPVRKERPTGSLEWGRKGKVRVRPATTRKPPAGRHRKAPHRTKAEVLIATHREKLNKIGSKAVVENDIARRINKGFTEMLTSRPGPLSEMDELALGMEQAMGVAAEAVENYRRNLIQRGFDPAFLMALKNVQDNYEQAATNWSTYIATVRLELAAEIAAAIRRTTGAVPDDDTLAG